MKQAASTSQIGSFEVAVAIEKEQKITATQNSGRPPAKMPRVGSMASPGGSDSLWCTAGQLHFSYFSTPLSR